MNDEIYDKTPLDQLQLLSDGKLTLIDQIYGLFKISIDKALQCFAEARSRREFEPIRIQAHSLKSSAGAVGLIKLSYLCRQLEKQSISEWTEIESLLSAIKEEV